jgi:regulatory protein
MAIITRISASKRSPNRVAIFIDGKRAFTIHINVVARHRLREGVAISPELRRQIEQTQVKQECFDAAVRFLSRRLHSRAELARKLRRGEFSEPIVTETLDDLTRLGYLDDARFAQTRALASMQHKQIGQRRAKIELLKAGVRAEVADRAVADVYAETDPTAVARKLAERQAPRLRRLPPEVARRRLAGLLQRRGFDYEAIRPVIDEVLGPERGSLAD